MTTRGDEFAARTDDAGCRGDGDCRGDGNGDKGGCRDARATAGVAGAPGLMTGTVAVAAAGPTLADPVDEHFGRSAYFQLVDLASRTTRPVANTADHHGAGISAVELVATQRAAAVIAMRLGPKAVDAFRRAGIPVYGATPMTVGDAVDALAAGALQRLDLD